MDELFQKVSINLTSEKSETLWDPLKQGPILVSINLTSEKSETFDSVLLKLAG